MSRLPETLGNGFWISDRYGYPPLLRYGFGLTETRIAQYLFRRHFGQ
jgi:hypothetical protein